MTATITPHQARYEIKAVIPASRFADLQHLIAVHPAAFRVAYPDRRINNIYFDDHRLSSYQDNLIGAAERKKLRLRWYGETDEPTRAVMELKSKRNRLGWKDRAPLDLDGLSLAGLPTEILISGLERRLPPDLKTRLALSDSPVVYNRYRRQYFEDAAGQVRLTLDRDLAFRGLLAEARLRFDDCLDCSDFGILEIKFGSMDDLAGAQIMHDLGIRMSKFSKYVFGLQKTAML